MNIKLKKTGKDFLYNALGAFVPVLCLQILILPYVSSKMDGEAYGLVLTVIALTSLIPAGLGNVLNNVHLLEGNQYKKLGRNGDIGILLFISETGSSIVLLFFLFYYGIQQRNEVILILLLAFLMLFKEYYTVFFWINLDYKKIFLANTWLVVGYAMGVALFRVTGNWEFIYLCGNFCSILYCLKNHRIEKALFFPTARFKHVLHSWGVLITTTILARALQYVDRLLLFPLLGGTEVTIYYISTVVGKMISMGMSPVNSFLLSQFAKREGLKRRMFFQILGVTIVVGILGYVACIVVARPVLTLLYKPYVEKAMPYVYVTTLTSVINAMSLVISPILLKFCNINWQICISGASFIVYIIVSMALLETYDLMGFCLGGYISNLFTLILMVSIYIKTYKPDVE